jgi:hypothetical protein
MEHLRGIAPLAVVPDSFQVAELQISPPGPDPRPIRFKTIWAFTDTAGLDVDTSLVLTAQLRRTGKNTWTVAGYDNVLLEHIASIIDEDRRRIYDDLLEAIHHVYHIMTAHGWYYNEGGIPPAEVHRLIQADTTPHVGHANMRWDLTPPAGPQVAQILWMTAPDSATCALPLTHGELRPEGFDWVRDNIYFTCRGRGNVIYSKPYIGQEVQEIAERQGVIPPRRN